jgi:hypothetical protein
VAIVGRDARQGGGVDDRAAARIAHMREVSYNRK